MKFYILFVIIYVFALIGGCAAISEQTKSKLQNPSDCSRAEQDIEILEVEIASVGKRVVSGVRSIMPTGMIIGLLKGDYKDGVRIAIGKYNKDIEAKIKEIKDACGIE